MRLSVYSHAFDTTAIISYPPEILPWTSCHPGYDENIFISGPF